MIIRQGKAGDAPALCDITNDIIRNTLITFTDEERSMDAMTRNITARGQAFLVAEMEGKAVGFATYAPFRPGPGYARTRELSIQLAKNARGRGLGKRLLSRLEAVARADGLHVLIAAVSGANPGAVTFHENMGFTEVARLPEVGRKQGRWLDLILLQKVL
ncbi:GNAT family N-acetyltransferase [Thalassococcus sp. S3]|uniref:GNAT family N-acetyltransferase n=1 Tax=Thalassococcus sp. S3 TaxID=2017482 RepID=UPI00102432D2|nr:GNAT family N-acetyltransferase [Thalassococcus sp. S3]QBF32847.1 GNAT family N-acetyltransferase [Thalassococcus sp. S3]